MPNAPKSAPAAPALKTAIVDGVELTLSQPDRTERDWVGQTELLDQILACWLRVADADLPLTPRLIGLPGVGKTTLAMAAARKRKQPVYVYQCTADTRPEDLLVTPVLAATGKISYHASPVVSAMLQGGIAILDEGNRMSEKSWASLAPLLDHRRTIESVVAGIVVDAHPEFRCCVTMNDDASTYEIPDYIMSRIQPAIEIGFPKKADEMAILQYNVPFAPAEMLALTVEFLQAAHRLDLPFSTRDGINCLRLALKRRQAAGGSGELSAYFEEAIRMVLGNEALELEVLAKKRRKQMGGSGAEDSFSLKDFFFEEGDGLDPEAPEEPGAGKNPGGGKPPPGKPGPGGKPQ
ncbi:MAG: AAA family ATPase [Planctomycetota bacterium]